MQGFLQTAADTLENQQLAALLNSGNFSIVIDETTDITALK